MGQHNSLQKEMCKFTFKAIQEGCEGENLDVIKSAIEDYEKILSTRELDLLADTQWDSEHFSYLRPIFIVEIAASSFKPEILALILRKGLYTTNRRKMFPIYWLVRENYSRKEGMNTMKDMLKMLCDVGYSVNDRYQGQTPLSYVSKAHGENSEIAKTLIQAGADVNKQDYNALTPLHYVCKSHREKLELAKTLIEAGADVNIHDWHGLTPLLCVCRDHVENLELGKKLIEAGAHVNDQDHEKNTPLSYTVGLCKPNLSHYLLKKGADWSINTKHMVKELFDCECFLDASDEAEFLTTLKILIAYGFDVNKYLYPNKHVKRLLSEYALISLENSREMYEILRQSGFRFTDSLLQSTSWISTTHNPLSLQRLCANKIRACMGPKLNKNINVLGDMFLTTLLKDFIMLKDVVKLDTL